MALKRVLPFFVMIFALTGCFRQATDTFDTVDSGSGDAATQVIAPSATTESAITIIAPNTNNATATDVPIATDVEPIVVSTVDNNPTIVPTIVPTTAPLATDIPPPTVDTSSASTLPTATEQAFITPDPVVVNEDPTAIPTVVPTSDSSLAPTPSDEEAGVDIIPPNECEYVVQAGDNAFRIAFNHGVALEDLLAVNSLPAVPILQPGQRLTIPDCDVEDSVDTTTEQETVEVTEEAAAALEEGFQLHIVAQGETLLSIARQYGVTVNDIINENTNLTDPNRITPGDELLIPPSN
ncbi:MAG: LysM peptidoglycan-binding domain-containing protein [Anaerolineae bacterium]|nr:LysM peptidoglycan-binding domain-containing protein [Anaerolineae bacterium]MDQ7033707.1 LysM peptidoglycan-binding domain-containing protein [Anaerolineae bacterium]